jgi:hypothetical protein
MQYKPQKSIALNHKPNEQTISPHGKPSHGRFYLLPFTFYLGLSFAFCLVLSACGTPARPVPVAVGPPLRLVDELVAQPSPGPVIAIGYLYTDGAGASLVGRMSVIDGAARPLGSLERRIWLGPASDPALAAALAAGEAGKSPLVRVEGQLEGPGTFGPDAAYPLQFVSPTVKLITVQETTIGALLEGGSRFNGQAVRLAGGLLLTSDSALLAERLGSGGVPASDAQQLKLSTLTSDPALLAQLRPTAGDSTRYGQVLVEGFWRDNVLYPLTITLSNP